LPEIRGKLLFRRVYHVATKVEEAIWLLENGDICREVHGKTRIDW